MFPSNVTNRLNIVDVNTVSRPINQATSYATSPNTAVVFKPKPPPSDIFNTVSDGVSSNFTDARCKDPQQYF